MLEIIGKQILRKISSFPNDKGRAVFIPWNHIVGDRIIHQLERFGQERRRNRPLCHFDLFFSSIHLTLPRIRKKKENLTKDYYYKIRNKSRTNLVKDVWGTLFLDRTTKEKKSSQEFPTPAIEPREEEARVNEVVIAFAFISFHELTKQTLRYLESKQDHNFFTRAPEWEKKDYFFFFVNSSTWLLIKGGRRRRWKQKKTILGCRNFEKQGRRLH